MFRLEPSENKVESIDIARMPGADIGASNIELALSDKEISNKVSNSGLPVLGLLNDSEAADNVAPAKENPQNTKQQIAENCPSNADYLKLINKAIRNFYDPSVISDPAVLRNKFNCQINNTSDAIQYAGEAAKAFGDKYTRVVSPAKAVLASHEKKGEIGAIGVELKKLPETSPTNLGPVLINSVFDDTPAASVDLQKGDVITHVDGAHLATLSYAETIGRIRGKVGKPVSLTVERDGKSHDVIVNRTKKVISNIKEDRLDGNIGYVKLADFDQDDTVEDVQKALQKHGDASAYIIDMRNNGGGQFKLGYQLASLFMDEGLLLSTRRRIDSSPTNPEYRTSEFLLTDDDIEVKSRGDSPAYLVEFEVKRYDDIVDKPFVVLVNGNTSSSAEIFTAAIQADDEGIIMGSQTDGKGIGQTIYKNMPGGSSIRVTTFRIFRPDGTWTGDDQKTENGIIPDMVVNNPKGAKIGGTDDAQLIAAKTYLQSLVNESRNR